MAFEQLMQCNASARVACGIHKAIACVDRQFHLAIPATTLMKQECDLGTPVYQSDFEICKL